MFSSRCRCWLAIVVCSSRIQIRVRARAPTSKIISTNGKVLNTFFFHIHFISFACFSFACEANTVSLSQPMFISFAYSPEKKHTLIFDASSMCMCVTCREQRVRIKRSIFTLLYQPLCELRRCAVIVVVVFIIIPSSFALLSSFFFGAAVRIIIIVMRRSMRCRHRRHYALAMCIQASTAC